MKAKRKRHRVAFTANVGFEALVGLQTVSQPAREFAVHPTQVALWRATIRDRLSNTLEAAFCVTAWEAAFRGRDGRPR